MCLLVVSEPNSTPSKKDLDCASCNNPHGFGYAVIAGNEIIRGRGMSAKKVIAEFLQVRKQYPDSYAMYHARLATHGVKNEDNCHPFIVGGDKQTYLAHNGILDVQIAATDKRSDTRVFAEDVLPAMGGVTALDDDNVWKIVSKWATGSKIAVLTVDPNAKEYCYIINEDAGHWDNEGNWWSNTTYKITDYYSWASAPTQTKPRNLADRIFTYDDIANYPLDYTCPTCDAIPYEDANPYYCEMCFTCYDCSGMYNDTCLCWSPDADRYQYAEKSKAWYDEEYLIPMIRR